MAKDEETKLVGGIFGTLQRGLLGWIRISWKEATLQIYCLYCVCMHLVVFYYRQLKVDMAKNLYIHGGMMWFTCYSSLKERDLDQREDFSL